MRERLGWCLALATVLGGVTGSPRAAWAQATAAFPETEASAPMPSPAAPSPAAPSSPSPARAQSASESTTAAPPAPERPAPRLYASEYPPPDLGGTSADADVVHFEDRRLSLQLGGLWGSVVGNFGAVVGFTAAEAVTLVAGVGMNPWGLQAGAALRVRPKIWPRKTMAHALTLAPGFTTGPWEMWTDHVLSEDPQGDEQLKRARHLDRAYWVQLDVGYELRLEGGLSVFIGPGMSVLLNADECEIEGRPCAEVSETRKTIFPLVANFSAFVGYSL